ncbi:phosphoenolpyruvate--protein phosphotransferase [Brevibacillus sp. SIMBA_040]|uniref:phosphoenolpyruvate--protein phosphotransferase n=1 Tax=unclassified Brevibacillus TaxID=2684853 RepID=UPI00397CAAB5
MIKGISASKGIAIGTALVIARAKLEVRKRLVKNTQLEIRRFHSAIETAKDQLHILKSHTGEKLGTKQAAIFEAQLQMLEDPEITDYVVQIIGSERLNAEYALQQVVNNITGRFEALKDAYFKERVVDIKDIANRLKQILLGIHEGLSPQLTHDCILVAEDLTPSETAQLDKEKIMGFVTEIGGGTSHTAIMAQSLEIPAVVGAGHATKVICSGDVLILDGEKGEVLVNPAAELLADYFRKQAKIQDAKRALLHYKDASSLTKDGRRVEIAANIGTPMDIERVLQNGAEGVGLFRTEFLYMDRDMLPTEEDQFIAYKEVIEKMEGRPVVIRTLDIGGDKKLSYLPISDEMNPFLGYRAIRLCLDQKDVFQTQIRAMLRASLYGNMKIMFPMISNLKELREAKSIVNEIRVELEMKKIPFNKDVEIGMMIEVPAAAIISDLFAKEVDFFSIGTNDLIQYTVAVDRMNDKIAHLYDPFHPAIIRLIKSVIDNGHKERIWVGMCGEVAGDPDLIPLLLGMGLDEFSMSPGSVLEARKLIGSLEYQSMKKMSMEVLQMGSSADIRKHVTETVAASDGGS